MTLAIGCVAEPTAKYLDQAERLLQSWRWFAGRYANADFHVCVVGDVAARDRARYEKYGAHVRGVSRFSARHAASNKLRFLELAEVRDAERVVLLDCDTIVVQEPVELFRGEPLIAKMADVATVPTAVLHRIFAEFGVPPPPASCRCTVSDEPTIPYFNAGVLSFSSRAVKELVPEWIRCNRMLIERIDMLGERQGFCEQASLSVAVAVTGTPFTALDNRLNFPAHFQDRPVTSPLGQTDPTIIHYHWLVDDQGRLQGSPYPNVNRRIEAFNDRVAAERRV
ncbi:MAG: hypothetical protein IPJ62_09745 [Betaproteobacteria bacterium]|nr:hypothetical protein [Betaproteobacteria bacterium]